jgi:hypothetical protein
VSWVSEPAVRLSSAFIPTLTDLRSGISAIAARYSYILSARGLHKEITGLKPPPSPVTAHSYTEHGLGLWFELADESLGELTAPQKLAEIKSASNFSLRVLLRFVRYTLTSAISAPSIAV